MRRIALILSITLALFACAMFGEPALSRAKEKKTPVAAAGVTVSDPRQGQTDSWTA
jgi:hypothetical protein